MLLNKVYQDKAITPWLMLSLMVWSTTGSLWGYRAQASIGVSGVRLGLLQEKW